MGFEPTIPVLPGLRFSRPAHSARLCHPSKLISQPIASRLDNISPLRTVSPHSQYEKQAASVFRSISVTLALSSIAGSCLSFRNGRGQENRTPYLAVSLGFEASRSPCRSTLYGGEQRNRTVHLAVRNAFQTCPITIRDCPP